MILKKYLFDSQKFNIENDFYYNSFAAVEEMD